MSESETEVDWIHLPPGVEAESLWCCLHDANVRTIRSDLRNATVVISLDVFYLREAAGLPDDAFFEFQLTGVRAVRALTYALADPTDGGAGGRYETVTWWELEASLGEEELEIERAELARAPGGVSLRLSGMHGAGGWYELSVHGEQLLVGRSDGLPFSLEALRSLGEAYWDAFSRRASDEAS